MARPRKKIVEDYEAGEQVDLHKLAEATKVEPLEEPKRKVAKGEYVIYKDFEYLGVEYKTGDDFSPPSDWTRDLEYDEFRKTQSMKQRSVQGIAFMVPGEIINPKTKERNVRIAILPLEEV